MGQSRFRAAFVVLGVLACAFAVAAIMPSPAVANVNVALTAGVAIAVLLSGVAAAAALLALRRSGEALAQMRRLEASVDMALRSQQAAAPRPEPMSVAPAPTEKPDVTEAEAPPIILREADNVVPLRSAEQERVAKPAVLLAASVLTAATARPTELSLQPIVSVSSGKTLGFDVFRSVESGGQVLNIRDIAEPPAGFDIAAFEAQTVLAAIHTARRRLGEVTDQPLHVAVSDAFLRSTQELDRLTTMAREYPLIAGALVFAVDARCFDPAHPAYAAVSQLASAGFGLAAEMADWQAGSMPGHAALQYKRIPAQRLLRSGVTRSREVSRLLDDATGSRVRVIATGVTHDRDAMALLDLGVDLMVGDRFCAPRRLRPERVAEAKT